MEPTERDALALPVPRAWLDPYVADATRLDRLIADRDLAERLAAAGYVGRERDYVASELIKYGYAVLIAWMRNASPRPPPRGSPTLVKASPGLVSFQLSHPQGGTPHLVAELFWHSEDAFTAWVATPESAEVRNHAKGCGTTFTTYTGDVAEV